VGKTSLGRSIARALGRKFQRISLGGMHDEAEIRATAGPTLEPCRARSSRAFAGRKPTTGIMLDEIDKLGATSGAIRPRRCWKTLDPEQNNTFRDNYLDVPFDLSKALFICTAQPAGHGAAALLDRMELIPLEGYSEEEKLHIANRYLVPRQIKENGITPEQIEFPEDAVGT